MALVDPRLLDTLRTPTQTPVGTTLRDLDAEMTSILEKSDVTVSEKVRLYNQALLRYNDMAKDRAAKPTPVVVVKENEPIVATDVMSDVVTTLPKTLQEKGSQLVSGLNTTTWKDRGELLHEGLAIPGSNVVDLVHDLLRKRKTSEPSGGNSSPAKCAQLTYPWNWPAMSLGCSTFRNVHEYRLQRRNQRRRRRLDRYSCQTIGNLTKTTASIRDRHTTTHICLVVILTILLSTSPRSYNWCPDGVVPWDDRTFSKYTTTLNVSEVTAVLPH